MLKTKKEIIKKDTKTLNNDQNTSKEIPNEIRKGKYFYGVGGRKTAKARVRIYKGKGEITINGKKAEEYFKNDLLIKIIDKPLTLTNNSNKFDLLIKVVGGGKRGQADAIRHGISRALVSFNQELKTTLKKAGFLTRDPRIKERKKYGLKRARKAPQYRKR